MKTTTYSLIILIAVMLAACGGAAVPPAPPQAATVAPSQPAVPAVTPFVSPLESPLQPPVVPGGPGGSLDPKPQSAKWENAPQAALNARKLLAEQLKVDVNLIGLVSAELVDWPDACLGIEQPNVMCAQIIITGYRVVLSANGLEYEFHTNESGDVVRPVSR